MGIWSSLTLVGNILGAIIPSFWATTTPNSPWGWSFFVPGFIVGGMGLITFFFLVTGRGMGCVSVNFLFCQFYIFVSYKIYECDLMTPIQQRKK